MNNTRVKKVIKFLLNERGVDRVIDTHLEREYVECLCKRGSDNVTYRVYGNEDSYTVTER